MKVWFTGTDGGDGSIGVSFYESQECIELLEEHDPETYRGEGGNYFEVPDGAEIKGIDIQTLAEVKEQIGEEEEDEDVEPVGNWAPFSGVRIYGHGCRTKAELEDYCKRFNMEMKEVE